MKKIYFTLAGTNHYFGNEIIEKDTEVRLVKEPDNKYDGEDIRVEIDGLGKVGYVANSVYSVLGESMSAGRIYDRIGDTAIGRVLYNLPNGIICTLNEESIIYTPPEIKSI